MFYLLTILYATTSGHEMFEVMRNDTTFCFFFLQRNNARQENYVRQNMQEKGSLCSLAFKQLLISNNAIILRKLT